MAQTNKSELVNCLRNEKVVVRHIPRENAMIGTNPKHVLSGGMADSSFHRYTVPQLDNGQLKDPLTKAEKEFLEVFMGLEPNALSIYKKEKNYWWNYQVALRKADNYLDLSNPDDYIKYKILLLNTNLIAPSLEALQNYPKATYEYVIIHETDEATANRTRISATMEAYKEYGKIENSPETLRLVIETITGRPVSSTTKLISLQDKVDNLIQQNSKFFLKVVQDPMLSTKVLIREAIEAGLIANRGGQLYLRDGDVPLCDEGTPTLSVAAEYINEPKNSELKLTLEAKIKDFKTK